MFINQPDTKLVCFGLLKNIYTRNNARSQIFKMELLIYISTFTPEIFSDEF